MSDPEAHKIGRYALLEEVGRGAMGVVYRARDERLGREVALKVLWPHLAGEATFVSRFEREAQAAAAIEHPNVVRVHDVGEADGYRYIAMEFVRGRTLRDHLERKGRVPAAEALRLFRGVLDGLAAAHDRGLVHRDLKPGNILIDEATGAPKVADFGLARASEEATALTATGEILGTPEYLAPEIARGEEASRRSDLYAAGVVLYRMLTGRLPFEGATPAAILEAHRRGRYAPPSTEAPDLPPAANAVVSRFLAREGEDRYPMCRVAIEDLDRWARGEEVLPALPQPYEAIDENLARRPLPWWRAVWNRVDMWVRYQCLEVFDGTERTVAVLQDGLRTMETDLRDAHRRFEEMFLLHERLGREIEEARRAAGAAEARAEDLLVSGDEAGARANARSLARS